jgi:hypothetical protein
MPTNVRIRTYANTHISINTQETIYGVMASHTGPPMLFSSGHTDHGVPLQVRRQSWLFMFCMVKGTTEMVHRDCSGLAEQRPNRACVLAM